MDPIMQKILTATNISIEELEQRITDKQHELSGLISREGAAYIIAKELGLDVVREIKRRLEIRNIVPGIKNLTLTARVLRTFGPHEFERDGKKSAVANVLLADSTGVVRLSLWDQQLELFKQLVPGTAIEISGAYTKADSRGAIEIRLGKRGAIRVAQDSELPPLEQLKLLEQPRRTAIAELKEADVVEVRAAVVQLFNNNPFFEVCPVCGTRAQKEAHGTTFIYKCGQHGQVQPNYNIVLTGVIDDGTANIRAVWFRDAAAALIDMPLEVALAKREKLLESIDVLGKEFVMTGRVKRNKMFDRLEFVVSTVAAADAKAEAEMLLSQTGQR